MTRLIHWIVQFKFIAWPLLVGLMLIGCRTAQGQQDTLNTADNIVQVSVEGVLYHGVFPGGRTGEEDDITLTDLTSYEQAVGKPAAWVYFSNNWYQDRTFPLETATWIRRTGAVPFIRLMLIDSWEQPRTNRNFPLARIAAGDFDRDFQAWARAAKAFGSPLLVEYGVEVNGYWFPWNGKHNGGSKGPELFRKAYRHIIEVMRDEKADNIKWVFHVDVDDNPRKDWNRFENYYPGSQYIDWIGFSAYGAQTPTSDEWPNFRELVDPIYHRLKSLAAGKPIMVLEFGVTAGHPKVDQAQWAKAALTDLLSGRWPEIQGFSWWNEAWENDADPAHDTNMRVQDNPTLSQIFQNMVGKNPRVADRLPF